MKKEKKLKKMKQVDKIHDTSKFPQRKPTNTDTHTCTRERMEQKNTIF